ncbi:MAG TPA: hydrogenase nickel incorporation protein HypB [Planctomycetota bacterium]|jgi:hydrogenase nickel incorporation protein HypB
MEIRVVHKVLKANDEFAQMAREKLQKAGVLALNVLSAPGSGKTSLLEMTIKALKSKLRIGVIEGDPDTARDAERIAPLGVPVVQINTDGGCHLDANLIHRVLDDFDLANIDVLFIENVGNLVCPAEFDLGEAGRVAVLSVPEGHDKPAKYAKVFHSASVVVLNKIDLLPYVDFDQKVLQRDLARINPDVPVLKVSCRTGEGLSQWHAWLEKRLQEHRQK